MSDDELEKLAAAMKNISPSKAARKSGMDAAMAAFDTEFASETAVVTEAAEENISATAQGLSDAQRPTGQSTYGGYVQTLGRDTMSRVKEFFSFKPKTMMMMGTCAAALFATSLYIPNTRFEDMPKPALAEVGASKAEAESDTIVVTARKEQAGQADVQEEPAVAQRVEVLETEGKISDGTSSVNDVLADLPAQESSSDIEIVELEPSPAPITVPKSISADKAVPATKPAPQAQGGINSISDLLNQVRTDSAKTEAENRDREAKFRQRRDEQAGLLSTARQELAVLERRANLPKGSSAEKIKTIIEQEKAGKTDTLDTEADIAVREYRAVLQQKNNVALFMAQQHTLTTSKNAEAKLKQSTQTQISNGYILEEVPAEYKNETKTIVTKEATTELVKTPPTFETVAETVVTQSASTELVTIPPVYGWVDGEIEGSSVEYVTVPAQYETVQEPVVVQEASTELVSIPPVYNSDGTILTPASTQERVIPSVTKMETRRFIKTPASTVERRVPNEIKDGKTRMAIKPARTVERAIPAVTKQVTRRVIKTPASTQERIIPPGTRKEVNVRTLVAPQKFYLRDENGQIIREFESRDQFEKYQANLTTMVAEKPVSTFSVDVDTASYSFLRGSLNRGQIPPRSSIRLEEMINYFPYDYEAPRSADEPFKANVTVTPNPWNTDTKLMHIGIKGYVE